MAADLSAVTPENKDEILCPLCPRLFGRANLGSLTKEHPKPSAKTRTLAASTSFVLENHGYTRSELTGYPSSLAALREAFPAYGSVGLLKNNCGADFNLPSPTSAHNSSPDTCTPPVRPPPRPPHPSNNAPEPMHSVSAPPSPIPKASPSPMP